VHAHVNMSHGEMVSQEPMVCRNRHPIFDTERAGAGTTTTTRPYLL
jgi:hypothetical protein